MDWTLTILPPITANVAERIAVRYRHAGDTAWKQCERTILIEGAERITSASCSSIGHDTVWADAGYEAIIPHPVQVQYTITNTGNVPLGGCSAAIVHSPMYALVNPLDSIQGYPVVQPGASASREWLLDPLLDQVQPLPEIISWVWSCDKLAATPQCTHSITLVAASPAAVVFTPWLLRFQAERNGPLPAAQELRLWTGGAAAMPWQLQSSTAWIDWQPSSGTDSARVMVVPNTTALPEGSHAGRIDMTAVPGVSPVGVRVVYDITTKTGMDDIAVPLASMLGQNYPNPAGGYTTITATLERQSKARLLLYDAYGRLVAVVHDGELPAGRSSFQIDTRVLPSGMYWYSLVAGGRTEARMMMVMKR
ncbi:MAG: T9SS type A sorting domain-containing protein [Ignavibacteria bacterium]|nr:T9SS type A sorting domain-containing protein [Ignavibacteria bacterium]